MVRPISCRCGESPDTDRYPLVPVRLRSRLAAWPWGPYNLNKPEVKRSVFAITEKERNDEISLKFLWGLTPLNPPYGPAGQLTRTSNGRYCNVN